MKLKPAILFILLSGILSSCDDGCVKCTGITADQQVCKDDYNNNSDYQNYVDQYVEQGGVCE